MKTTAMTIAAAAIAATLGSATAAVPCHLEAALGVSPDTYSVAELLTLRGAVEAGAVDVIAGIAGGNEADLRTLVARATADGAPLEVAALAD